MGLKRIYSKNFFLFIVKFKLGFSAPLTRPQALGIKRV